MKDDERRARRIAEIRSRRGSPERLKAIAEMEAARRISKKPPSSTSERKTPENSSSMHGHPWHEWNEMVRLTLEFLCNCAREGRMTSYGEVWTSLSSVMEKDLGSHRFQLPHLLGYVGTQASSEFELIPTALVVSQDDNGGPGPGFFRLAASLGRLPEEDAPEEATEWRMTAPQRAYWEQECQALFDHFADKQGD